MHSTTPTSDTAINELSTLLGRIPGLGPRSARRMVLFLLRNPNSLLAPIITSMQNVRQNVKTCECGNMSEIDPCTICSDNARNRDTVCVVEDVTSMWAIERSKCFNGIYYVMGKILSPTSGVGPDDLDIARLKRYVEARGSTEVILALNPTIEGQATAHYIHEMLDTIKCSRLRLGIPMGGELDYLDTGTIAAAINGRG